MPTLAEEIENYSVCSKKCHPGHVIVSKKYHAVLKSGGRRKREE
jgi:hypothetical protein